MAEIENRRAGAVTISTVLIVGVLGIVAATQRLQAECSLPALIERYNQAVDDNDLTEMERVARLASLLHPDKPGYGKAMQAQCESIKTGITLPAVSIECFRRPMQRNGI